MAGTNVERARAHERVGPQRGQLRDALDAFLAAQHATGIPDTDWCAGVTTTLAGLREAWETHVDFTESSNGLFDELLDDNVEIAAPEVDHLRRDHLVVSSAMTRAGEMLGATCAGPGDAKLRDSLSGIAKQVEAHRRRGAELLYNVYSVDPTGGG
jgi:hypothetical protein